MWRENSLNVLVENSEYKINTENLADGLALMKDIKDDSIATAFFDPQYRGILDKIHYGNEGKKRGIVRAGLQQMDGLSIVRFIKEINRVVKPSGHLFLWIDKFHLCTGIHAWIELTDFNIVDMIVWDKGKIGMGYRTRRKSEYLMVLQKSPVLTKGCWIDHSIPDVWLEKTEKSTLTANLSSFNAD